MKRYLPHIALTLAILVSWLYSAAYPVSGVRSLLTSEGLRWFMGHYADMLAKPLLVWLLLLSMAYGCLTKSRLLRFGHTYRESRARLMTLFLLLLCVALMALLTLIPHAVLLSVSGDLWPSPFSKSLIPSVAFIVVILSAFYGIIAGYYNTVSDIYEALLHGIRQGAPLLLFYLLIAQLYLSLSYSIGHITP